MSKGPNIRKLSKILQTKSSSYTEIQTKYCDYKGNTNYKYSLHILYEFKS